MKKTLKLLAAVTLIALTTAACQKEQLSDNSAEGTESVTFTVQTEVGTKAVADGDGSAAKIDQVLVAVYMKDGDTFRLYDEPTATYTASTKSATFSVNLIRKQTYQIVVWAQKTGAYDCTDGLKSIVRSSAKASVCNDDELDAFYASHEYVQGSATASTSIHAKRPFAQLNLITKDLRTGFEPSNVTVTYVSDTKFNALTGLSSEPAATSVTYSATQPNYKAQGKTLDAAKNTLVMNYLFAPETEQIVLPSVKMTAKLTEVVDFEVSNVPAKRNYRTNIIGNLLTEQTDFNITVDPLWGDTDINQYIAATVDGKPYTSIEAAFANATNGETIILANDVETAGITVPTGATTILNLAGKTIKAAAPQTRSANGEIALTVLGELTIIGEGTVNGGAGGDNVAVYVGDGGKAIINGGYFTVGADANGLGNSCIYTVGGEVVINGGYFRTEAAYRDFYYVLNQNNGNPGTIQVTGGKFENYNPTRGDDNLLGTFVASGYTSTKISDNPVVYEVGPVPGYMGAVLPEAPVVSGNVMTVNTENAQYALDGAYGSIDGMTIHFSAGTYPQLIFGRPNKYPGSHTIYRHGNFSNDPMSYEEFVAYKSQSTWTEGCMYERIISNVTFTAENGAVLTGMSYNAGAHIYGSSAESPAYDYVLDKGTPTVGSCYYHKLVASNIVYEGITFQKVAAYKPLDISSSSPDSVIDGVKVLNCHFIGTSKEGNDNQAIRFYTENQSSAAGTEGKVVRNLVVKKTTIDNFFQGIYTNGAYGVTVDECQISNTGHNAIALQTNTKPAVPAINLGQVKILSNRFENIGDRIIRIGNVAAGSSFTITGNEATNSGDGAGQVLKAGTLAAEGITYDIHSNKWGEGKTVYNPEFRDQ